jgi:glycosyltransferase involved in cell wall biosynthesis
MPVINKLAISVIMPVYNSANYLHAAIESILKQSFENFEFIIVDDGSTDDSLAIINSYHDKRIILIVNKENKGIVNALNEGLKLSRGKYVARMDADDISFTERFAIQYQYLAQHPTCKLCGSFAIAIDSNGNKLNLLKRPISNDEIKIQQLFKNSFIHPTVMIDRLIAQKFLYQEQYLFAEDFFLFSQICLSYDVHNINEPLLFYRTHEHNITSQKKEAMMASEKRVIAFILTQVLNEVPSKDDIDLHHAIIRRNFNHIEPIAFENHLLSLKPKNQLSTKLNLKMLDQALATEWFNFLYYSKTKQKLKKYLCAKLSKCYKLKHIAKLAVK